MRFDDCSPPSSRSLDQQRNALRKGLGRAMQLATDRNLDGLCDMLPKVRRRNVAPEEPVDMSPFGPEK